MIRNKDRLVLDLILGLIVVIGVSSSVSPWLEALYGRVAIWVFGAWAVGGVIWAVASTLDLGLRREIREADRMNAAAVHWLAEKHAAHPEVAKALSARLLAEKLQREQGGIPPAHFIPPGA